MTIPNEIQSLIQQLNQSLNKTEQKAYQGIILVRPVLLRFPNNLMLMRHFAYFNNIVLLINIARNNTRSVVDDFLREDLAELLGQVIDAKIGIENILKTLEELL